MEPIKSSQSFMNPKWSNLSWVWYSNFIGTFACLASLVVYERKTKRGIFIYHIGKTVTNRTTKPDHEANKDWQPMTIVDSVRTNRRVCEDSRYRWLKVYWNILLHQVDQQVNWTLAFRNIDASVIFYSKIVASRLLIGLHKISIAHRM